MKQEDSTEPNTAHGRYFTYLTAASSFLDFLSVRSLVYSNPFKEIRFIKSEKTLPPVILKEKQMSMLLLYFAEYWKRTNLKSKIKAYRMHVLTELLYSTGLRITEAANLRISDIDFDSATIRVREGKGGYSRIVVLNDYVRDVLSLYVNEIRDLIQSSWHDPKLLFGTGWERFGKWANETLREATEELSLPPVTCHGFRHALGFHLLRSGCPLRSIQSILGHKRIKNTEIYTKVEKEDLKKGSGPVSSKTVEVKRLSLSFRRAVDILVWNLSEQGYKGKHYSRTVIIPETL